MPTVITKTVKPSGGDYSLVSTAVAAIPADMVAADEQWDIVVFEQVGGYLDGFDMPSITTDATRYPRIIANPGDEYDNTTDTGSFLTAFRNFDGVITANSCNNLVTDGIGFKNTGTVSARAFSSVSNNITLSKVYGFTSAAYYVFDFNNAMDTTLLNCITEGGTRGVHTQNFSSGTITNHLSIDNTEQGFQKGSSSNLWVIKNALYLGPGAWTLGSGWLAGTDYNASSDTTAVGANSLQNRTTADLVDYAGNDYRTKSSSALATAGEGGTFIGYKLEASSGIEATVTEILNPLIDSSTVNVDYNVSANITEFLQSKQESSLVDIQGTIEVIANVTETLNSFIDNSVIQVQQPQSVNIQVTESLQSLSDTAQALIKIKVESNVTETLNSFVDNVNAIISFNVESQVTEQLSSFTDLSFIQLPTNWNIKPPVDTEWQVKTGEDTDWSAKQKVTTTWIKKG